MPTFLSNPLFIIAVTAVVTVLLARFFFRRPEVKAWLRPDVALRELEQTNIRLRAEVDDWMRRHELTETECQSLRRDLEAGIQERVRLQSRIKEVEGNYIGLAETNQRQQGEIDSLKHRFQEALEIKVELEKFINEVRLNVRPQN